MTGQPWIDPAQRIADLEAQVETLESQLASAKYQLGAAWEALPDGLEEHATLSAAIGEAFGSCVGVYAVTEGHTEAERDHLQRELDNALAELNEAREAVPDTIGNPSEDSLARRIELLVRQSEDRISELETEVTRWRIASESYESSQRDRATKVEDEVQRAAAEVARLGQQLDELRGVEAVRDGLLQQRAHLLDAIEALTEAVG